MLAAQPIRPGRVDIGPSVAGGFHHGPQRQGRGGHDLRLAAAVVDELAGGVGDADERGVGEYRRRAVAELVVELAPDQQNHVGVGHGGGPHRADHGRMIGGHQAAALLSVEIERAAGVEKAHELGASIAGAAPSDHQRAPSRPQGVDGQRDVGGVRRHEAGRLCRHPFREHELRGDRCAQHVGRNLDVDRPRLAHVAHGARDGLVEFAHHLLGDAGGARCPRHRPQDVDVGNVLQRAHIGLRSRRAAADQQHRCAGERGVRHGGDGVGDAGPGSRHGDAQHASEFGMGVRHMDGRAFVAHVDDADALARHMIPDRLDMAALQAEDAVDAARFEKTRDPGRARGFVGIEVDGAHVSGSE